jgi:hypothetical protein
VCATLDRHGVRVVLSGGGAASIYAPNRYESMDLDFIAVGLSRKVDSAMHELGFAKERQRYWTHPDSRFWVEFPAGPGPGGRRGGPHLRRAAHGAGNAARPHLPRTACSSAFVPCSARDLTMVVVI